MTVILNFRLCRKIFINYRKYSTNKKWKILFFGADAFSLASLKGINTQFQKGVLIDKLEIVTSSMSNAIGKFSQSQNLPVHLWPLKQLSEDCFDLGIVVSFGHLIPKTIIEYFPLGMINVHASLLPRWRGGAPIIHSLMNGDKISGVTIMQLQPHRFDIGNIIYQKSFEIKDDMLQPELHNNLAELGANLLIDSLKDLPNCLEKSRKQDNSLATLAPKVHPDIAKICWKSKTAQQVYNLYRALFGIYPLLTQFRGHIIKLHSISLDTDKPSDENILGIAGKLVFDKESEAIRIWCNDGQTVLVKSLSIMGKKQMRAVDFRNGYIKNISGELYFEDVDVNIKMSKKSYS